ncbi:hypothetical protein DyAD56_15460 [Dyella sp. AD56]|nr:hypothetical protein DyAD56_15460 [Dyella sp. AD56]
MPRVAHTRGIASTQIVGIELNAAGITDAGGGQRDTILVEVVAQHLHLAAPGLEQASVGHRARYVARAQGDTAHIDHLERRGRGATTGITELRAGGEYGLAIVGNDRSGIADIRRGDQRKALLTRRDRCALLNHHIVVAPIGEYAVEQETAGRRLSPDATAQERRIARGNVATEQVQRTRQQRPRIHLAASTKQNAVAIEQVHRTFGLDLTEDLAGRATGILNAIERNPVVAAIGLRTAALVEVERGVATDVEAIPGEDGLLRSLLDLHRRLAGRRCLHRRVGVLPQQGIGRGTGRHLEATRCNAIGYGRGEFLGGLLRCLLRADLRGHRGRRVVEIGDGLLHHALLQQLSRGLRGKATGVRHGAGGRCGVRCRRDVGVALPGKPGLAQWRCASVGVHGAHRQCGGDPLRQWASARYGARRCGGILLRPDRLAHETLIPCCFMATGVRVLNATRRFPLFRKPLEKTPHVGSKDVRHAARLNRCHQNFISNQFALMR